jgi:hypothetical protein
MMESLQLAVTPSSVAIPSGARDLLFLCSGVACRARLSPFNFQLSTVDCELP